MGRVRRLFPSSYPRAAAVGILEFRVQLRDVYRGLASVCRAEAGLEWGAVRSRTARLYLGLRWIPGIVSARTGAGQISQAIRRAEIESRGIRRLRGRIRHSGVHSFAASVDRRHNRDFDRNTGAPRSDELD